MMLNLYYALLATISTLSTINYLPLLLPYSTNINTLLVSCSNILPLSFLFNNLLDFVEEQPSRLSKLAKILSEARIFLICHFVFDKY